MTTPNYTARITHSDADSTTGVDGSVDATVFLAGVEVGEVTLQTNQADGVTFEAVTPREYWASNAMCEHFDSLDEDDANWARDLIVAAVNAAARSAT